MTFGLFNNFPQNFHYIQSYHNMTTNRQLQQQLIHHLSKINNKQFSFEEVTIPTVPKGVVIFEIGLAETDGFTFLNEEQTRKALEYISKGQVSMLDFFCAIRYYKTDGEKQQALKFDYYMLRGVFGKGTLELQVYHERGPRYVSPQDLTNFLVNNLNNNLKRKIIKELTPTN